MFHIPTIENRPSEITTYTAGGRRVIDILKEIDAVAIATGFPEAMASNFSLRKEPIVATVCNYIEISEALFGKGADNSIQWHVRVEANSVRMLVKVEEALPEGFIPPNPVGVGFQPWLQPNIGAGSPIFNDGRPTMSAVYGTPIPPIANNYLTQPEHRVISYNYSKETAPKQKPQGAVEAVVKEKADRKASAETATTTTTKASPKVTAGKK